jgi:hypothetical protein
MPGIVAEACNPTYFECGDWEDHSPRSAWEKSSRDPISTNGWARCHMPVIAVTWQSTNRRTAGPMPAWE